MREVILYGEMRRKFGPRFMLDVNSLADAVRALGSQIKGFRQYIRDRDFQVVCGKTLKKGLSLNEHQIGFNLPRGDIHIVPVIQGAGGGGRGIGKIIAGILIAAVAFWAAPAMGAIAFGSITYGNIAVFGIGLALSGLSQMMTAKKKNTQNEQKKDDSFMLNGTINVIEQGGPVPLIYGQVFVGSTLISAGLTSVDAPL
jgi:predicted phage tail protein